MNKDVENTENSCTHPPDTDADNSDDAQDTIESDNSNQDSANLQDNSAAYDVTSKSDVGESRDNSGTLTGNDRCTHE